MQCTKQTEHGTENTSVTSDTHYRVQEQKAIVRELTVILHLKSCTFDSSRIRVGEFLSPSIEFLKTYT